MRKIIVSLGAVTLLLPAGCTTAFNQRQFALRTDAEICSRYGVDRKSAVYLDCMALQEQRREAATARDNGLRADGTAIISGQKY